jgi:hypothetical protein
MDFPDGSTLVVLRAGAIDVHGDGEHFLEHDIGPCDVPQVASSAADGDKGGGRVVTQIQVRVSLVLDPNPDVVKGDRVRLPDGTVARVTSKPTTPRNPFTGWAPFLYFTLSSVT